MEETLSTPIKSSRDGNESKHRLANDKILNSLKSMLHKNKIGVTSTYGNANSNGKNVLKKVHKPRNRNYHTDYNRFFAIEKAKRELLHQEMLSKELAEFRMEIEIGELVVFFKLVSNTDIAALDP